MVIINRYRLKESDNKLYIMSYEINVCPICGEILAVIGSRKRKVIGSDSEMMLLIIRRLRCGACRTIHHELPDIVIPYKRHCAETIEKIVSGDLDGVNCETRTICRIKAWWAACILYFESVLASLREKYGTIFSIKSAPKEIVRALVNSHLWLHTRSAFLTD